MKQSTKNYRDINATPEKLYNAFTDPSALEIWQAPGDMTAKIHHFDLRVGGGYEMSLFYPDKATIHAGKTADKEDRYTARFIELIPNRKIVEAVQFNTTDPDFAGEMMIEITFEPVEMGTRVTFLFTGIPAGIKPADNEAGTISSLEKLAKYVETN
ncbi:SRPBCC family protein [Danxiaibacter flavus]|uniref:SRPBCC family protein n=1 Tax=Danxiaibacter flavus TaxID=3049108 RepID=A0ABV3ZC74_9BACT|nr:SRPBCC family protein [Chitinophagaceae bacterium DXS]